MILRLEFARQFPPECSVPEGPLWAYEDYVGIRCEYFIKTPLPQNWDTGVHWRWCEHNLTGRILCYSWGDECWWGFTDSQDLSVWLLRWA